MRYIESDDKLSLRGAALKEAIEDDIKLGLIPFWVSNIQLQHPTQNHAVGGHSSGRIRITSPTVLPICCFYS